MSQDQDLYLQILLSSVRAMHQGISKVAIGGKMKEEKGSPLHSVYADALELHGPDRGRTELSQK